MRIRRLHGKGREGSTECQEFQVPVNAHPMTSWHAHVSRQRNWQKGSDASGAGDLAPCRDCAGFQAVLKQKAHGLVGNSRCNEQVKPHADSKAVVTLARGVPDMPEAILTIVSLAILAVEYIEVRAYYVRLSPEEQ
jgi:hypothetical protein